jgi:hypothetical protein
MFDYYSEVIAPLLGAEAVRAPVWMYVQDQGPGTVAFVGASRFNPLQDPHPLRYGSERTHQFVRGEIILRPLQVVGTDRFMGQSLSQTAVASQDVERMLENGEMVLDHLRTDGR